MMEYQVYKIYILLLNKSKKQKRKLITKLIPSDFDRLCES